MQEQVKGQLCQVDALPFHGATAVYDKHELAKALGLIAVDFYIPIVGRI